jgi:small-conductance mechanosensitive channel
MDWYPWIVFIHAAALLLFFIAHGASMAVALSIRNEQNPDRLRALLDLSRAAIGPAVGVLAAIGILTGIVAGFMGDWWGQLWIWISLVLLLVIAFAMTPLMAVRLNAMRAAAGQATSRQKDPPPEDLGELRRLQAAWNPMPLAVAGIGSILVILYLMLVKPF